MTQLVSIDYIYTEYRTIPLLINFSPPETICDYIIAIDESESMVPYTDLVKEAVKNETNIVTFDSSKSKKGIETNEWIKGDTSQLKNYYNHEKIIVITNDKTILSNDKLKILHIGRCSNNIKTYNTIDSLRANIESEKTTIKILCDINTNHCKLATSSHIEIVVNTITTAQYFTSLTINGDNPIIEIKCDTGREKYEGKFTISKTCDLNSEILTSVTIVGLEDLYETLVKRYVISDYESAGDICLSILGALELCETKYSIRNRLKLYFRDLLQGLMCSSQVVLVPFKEIVSSHIKTKPVIA